MYSPLSQSPGYESHACEHPQHMTPAVMQYTNHILVGNLLQIDVAPRDGWSINKDVELPELQLLNPVISSSLRACFLILHVPWPARLAGSPTLQPHLSQAWKHLGPLVVQQKRFLDRDSVSFACLNQVV